jgi:HEAT repeat protein
MKKNCFLILMALLLIGTIIPARTFSEEKTKNYYFGEISNNNTYPVNLRVISNEGEESVVELPPRRGVVVPIETKAIEIYPHPEHPLGTDEQLNIRAFQSGKGIRKKVTGFGDRLEFDQPTGGFHPSVMKPDYDAELMEGAYYKEDSGQLGAMRIKHNDPRQRYLGTVDIAKSGDTSHVDALIDMAGKDYGSGEQRGAVTALGELGDDRASEVLGRILSSNVARSTKFAAGEALGKIGSGPSRAILRDNLSDDNELTRAAAARGLGKAENTSDIPVLRQTALNDPDWNVRECATGSLGNIAGEEADSALTDVMKTDSGLAGLKAEDILLEKDPELALDTLRYNLENGKGKIKTNAARSLGYRKDKNSVEALKKAAVSDNPELRDTALTALGNIGDKSAVTTLKKALDNDSYSTRGAAAEALGKIGGSEARAALTTLSDDNIPYVRQQAKKALDIIDTRAAAAKADSRAKAVASRNPRILELNDSLASDKKELDEAAKVAPDGEAVRLLKKKIAGDEKELKSLMKTEREQEGPGWIEKYRADDGTLPGGYLEDAESRLVKLAGKRKEQAEKVAGLRQEFEEAKDNARPVLSWNERLEKAREKYRDDFIEQHGPSSEWTEEERRAYQEGYNDLPEKERARWEEDKKKQREANRELGKAIKELSAEKAKLREMDRKAGSLKKQAEKEKERKEDTGRAQKMKTVRDNAGDWPAYDFADTERPVREPLTAENYTLFKAIDEINGMLKEVDRERARHVKVFSSPRFMACYYVKRGDLPKKELGVVLGKVDPETGRFRDSYWEWMANDMAAITDMWSRPIVPGMASNDGALMHIDLIKYRLNRSLDYLKDNSGRYERKPPIKEMRHVRSLMDTWRDLVARYHNDVDAYFAYIAEFLVLDRYQHDAIYARKKEALDKKYAGRENDKALQAKYEIELKKLNAWRDKIGEKVKEYWDGYKEVAGKASGWNKAQLPPALPESVGPHYQLKELNQEYMVLAERLKQVGRFSKEAGEIRKKMKDLESRINELIQTEKKNNGKYWMDAYRSPDGRSPGGFLKDGPVGRMMARRRMARGPSPSKSQKEPVKDKFYAFLKSCK